MRYINYYYYYYYYNHKKIRMIMIIIMMNVMMMIIVFVIILVYGPLYSVPFTLETVSFHKILDFLAEVMNLEGGY